jgi:hypothetical protein
MIGGSALSKSITFPLIQPALTNGGVIKQEALHWATKLGVLKEIRCVFAFMDKGIIEYIPLAPPDAERAGSSYI